MDWNFGNDLKSEQENTLILLDKQFENKQVRPSFEILGGTALLLHDIEHIVTVDIDVANKLDEETRSIVEPLISDAASEVATLAKNYKQRLVPYKKELFKNIDVYLLSKEDLVITKLGAGRYKDVEDLTKKDTELTDQINTLSGKVDKIKVERQTPTDLPIGKIYFDWTNPPPYIWSEVDALNYTFEDIDNLNLTWAEVDKGGW